MSARTSKCTAPALCCGSDQVSEPPQVLLHRDHRDVLSGLDLSAALETAVADGLEANVHRWLCFVGAQKRDWIEVQALNVPSGSGEADNLVVACWPCSSRKSGRTPEQAGMILRPAPSSASAREAP